MRLFVAVYPPERVLDALGRLHRPKRDGVRWTGRDQWHVTLRFLGEVADPDPVAAALAAAPLRRCEARLGPRVEVPSRHLVWLPVAGLDELARAVEEATAGFGQPPDDRRFRGHVTLARVRRRGRPGGLERPAFEDRFAVTDVRLVRSHLGDRGPRYEDLLVAPLS
jgi:RNA 2',3'-cyclic 3'-phosphodiesterase